MAKTGDIWISPCGRMELRCGRWQDVLADVTECDACITDPPYSERTHRGQQSGNALDRGGSIRYDCIDAGGALVLAKRMAEIAKRWIVVFSDHIAQPWHESALLECGWYVFAPVYWVKPNMPRFQGDGPSSTVEPITVARKKTTNDVYGKASRPGHYVVDRAQTDGQTVGKKHIDGMCRLISDYSFDGDLIVDFYAGSGTTLLAAAIEGRRCIGAEMDPKTFALAVKRLSKGYTPRMQFEAKPKPKQGDLI